MDSSIVLLPDHLMIKGRHFTISGGYTSKADGVVHLPYNDLLKVVLVNRRQKRIMYVSMLLTGLSLMFAVPFFRAIGNVILRLRDIPINLLRYGSFNGDAVQGAILTGLLAAAGPFLPAIITWVFYLLSRKTYIELTTMRGIFLVETAAFDPNHAESLVDELNKQIYGKNQSFY